MFLVKDIASNLKMNYDSERAANKLPVLSFELPPAVSLFLSSFFFLSSSDAKMAARLQPQCNTRVFVSDDDDDTSYQS